MNAININRDAFHGEWNYTISPTLPCPMILLAPLPISELIDDR